MPQLNFLGLASPGYYAPVEGGDIEVTSDTRETLNFPYVYTTLDPLPCVQSGPLQPGQVYCVQDGSTGDSTDSSGLWNNIFGAAGSFLRAWGISAGGKIQVGGNAAPPSATQVAAQQAAKNQETMLLIGGGLLLLVVVIVLVRK